MTTLDLALNDIYNLTTTPHQFAIENGELVPVPAKSSFLSKCFSLCCCQSQRAGSAFKAKETFLSEKVKVINSYSYDELSDDKNRVQRLFFGNLLNYTYDRSAITLGDGLERILDNDVAAKHTEKDNIDLVSQRPISETMSETHFALRLGVVPEKVATRYNAVYYLLSRSQEKLGVYKPKVILSDDKDVYGSAEIREAHLAEVVNSMIDTECGFGLVPYTQLFTYNNTFAGIFPSNGSYQFYVKDAPLLFNILEGTDLFSSDYKWLQTSLDTQSNREWDFTNFEEFAFLDLISGNNDHHFKNILVKQTSRKKGILVAIDNGNSFPWCHDLDLPSYKTKPFHTYKWKALPQAQKAFSTRMLAVINRTDSQMIEDILRKGLVNETVSSSLKNIEGKVKTYKQRIEEVRDRANDHERMADIADAVLELTDNSKEATDSKEEDRELLYI